jgi:tetratricopeptide (TPR) repeat protein
MRTRAALLFLLAGPIASCAGTSARADGLTAGPQTDDRAPQAQSKENAPQAKPEPAPQTPAEIRADLYKRLAASKDADETEGLVGLLLHAYAQSGSDSGDLLLARARKAMQANEYSDAEKILDSTIELLPDWAEGWNARATARYLDDDYNGSMADIAETLKREPNHLGAMMGMGAILESRDKREEALKVYERVLAIAPHWRNAEKPLERLKAELAGQEL